MAEAQPDGGAPPTPDDFPAAPVVGVGAVVWKDGRVLLIQRGKPPRRGSWSLPGGHQEVGETVAATARREVREETGVEVRLLGIAAVVDLIEREGERVRRHFTVVDFLAEWADGEAVAGDDASAVAWATPAECPGYGLNAKVLEIIDLAARRLAERRAGAVEPLTEAR